MNCELFIASRLRLEGTDKGRSPSLIIALVAMSLAMVVMILAIVVTTGFKRAIEGKIYHLEPHVAISDANLTINGDSALLVTAEVCRVLDGLPNVAAAAGWLEKPVMLKTGDDFEVLQLRGLDTADIASYIGPYLLADGDTVPCAATSWPPVAADTTHVLISRVTATELGLKVGDRVMAYFVGERIKARRLTIGGIFDTQFDSFDRNIIVADGELLRRALDIPDGLATRVAVTLNDPANESTPYEVYAALSSHLAGDRQFEVMPVAAAQGSFFAWLSMLDMNVAVIIVLMLIVSGFTLISSLLMIVLRRIPVIGLLKALGATNRSVRLTFILLTHKLILLAMLIGNGLGIVLALVQQHWHIVKLDPTAYYMSSVPIAIDVRALLLLNLGYLIVSALTLIIPSLIISTIKPSTTMRFE